MNPKKFDIHLVFALILVNSSAGWAADKHAIQGIKGVLQLEHAVQLPEPARTALITKQSGEPKVSLVFTESGKVLRRNWLGGFSTVLNPVSVSTQTFAVPDFFGRSLGISENAPGGGFTLLNAKGKRLARIPALQGWRYIFSEPVGPTIVTRPEGGWAGWPSLWSVTGKRDYTTLESGWPPAHAVKAVKFSPNGAAFAVQSGSTPGNLDNDLRLYSSTGALIWKITTPTEDRWTTVDFVFSNSGKHIGLASRTRIQVYSIEGKTDLDMPLESKSEQHLDFSLDDKKIAIGAADAVQLIDVEKASTVWSWDAKKLAETISLPQGKFHISRIACSRDCSIIAIAGFISDWIPWTTEFGEKSSRMEIFTDVLIVLQDGVLLDALKLEPYSFLWDPSESHQSKPAALAISEAGTTIVAPRRSQLLTFKLIR